ncbi:MAG: GH39 family glycosyl hydrolase [Bilifractor sp.]|jgi:xylan 1,4-beta-xylosidase
MYEITSVIPPVFSFFGQISKAFSMQRPSSDFFCLLSGSLKIQIKDDSYLLAPSDILYIKPDETCSIIPLKSSTVILLEFHPWLLADILGPEYTFLSYFSGQHPSSEGREYAADLASLVASCHVNRSSGQRTQIFLQAFHFLHHFSMERSGRTDSYEDRLMNFINENYRSRCLLEQAAKELGCTPQYLSSYIRKKMHTGFIELVTKPRLAMARLLLQKTDEPLSRVASLSGFPNQLSFQRAFEESFHTTPGEYANRYRPIAIPPMPPAFMQIMDYPLIMDYLYNYLPGSFDAPEKPPASATVTAEISPSSAEILRHPWNVLLNIGTSSDFEKPRYRYSLKIIQDALHFQYGRFLEFSRLIRQPDPPIRPYYDFSRFFDAVDFLLKIHMKPFIELSGKPFHIYQEPEDSNSDYRNLADYTSYDKEFPTLFSALLRSCVNRYGMEEVSSWQFELWARYSASLASMEPPTKYSHRFQQTAELLKDILPGAKLGGPGFNLYREPESYRTYLTALCHLTHRPDFISVIYFPYLPVNSHDNGNYPVSSEADLLQIKLTAMNEILREEGFAHTPLFVTELGAFTSSGNFINDSTYPSAYLVYQMVQNHSLAQEIAYWLASDTSLQYEITGSPFWGGNGIISSNGLPKSGFYALRMLNLLDTVCTARTRNYIVTRNGQTWHILFFRLVRMNKDFAMTPRGKDVLHYPFSAFESEPPLDLTLRISGMESGSYLLREEQIDLIHGNILNSWRKLNYWNDLRAEECEFLLHDSAPSVQMQAVTVEDHFDLTATLSYNEVRLVTLEKHV